MSLFSLPGWAVAYCLAVCAVLGLVMGSALHCLAWRIAHGQRWAAATRSACPACGHTLAPADLVPLFGWLRQRGKCRWCGSPISVRYPVAEAILAVVYVSLLLRFGLAWETVQYVVLCSCLFCLSWVDWDTQTIPHRFLAVAAAARLVYIACTAGTVANVFAQSLTALWHGLALGGSILLLALVLDKLLGKESMGGGDIKLLAVLGMYFTLPCCLLLVVLACVLGIVLALGVGAKRGIAFPFGPALSAAAWLTLLIGQPVTQWYMGLF
jgi:leader peptidase (prepilin peptidase)/N-methyltransferase